MSAIPLVDLRWQTEQVRDEIVEGWARVLDESAFILGPQVDEFEAAFAEFCDVRFCVGVGNGTDAIELALRAADLNPGGTVVVPANTFVATALAPMRAGFRVKLVDCLPSTYLIDEEQAVAAVRSGADAVIPVHLFGQIAPIDFLLESVPDALVVGDAAQAQGSTRFGRGIGQFGRVAATSFYPGKNLGAFGDAGAVLTDDESLAERARALHNWGSDRKYHHPVAGFNSRLDSLQAVVLNAKLSRLRAWNDMRRQAAAEYNRLLAGVDDVSVPSVSSGNDHVFHIYAVEVENREQVMASMLEQGIGVGVHYPIPVHLLGATRDLGYKRGDFPHAERAAQRMLSLPIFPGIKAADQERVIDALVYALSLSSVRAQ